MPKKSLVRLLKLFLLCVLAAGANFLFNTLSVYSIKIPLFLDTVFNAAVCFAVGLIPGIVTALMSYIVIGIRNGSFDPFVLCAITEVLLVWLLKPSTLGPSVSGPSKHINYSKRGSAGQQPERMELHLSALPETALTSFISVFARLMVLYVVCCIVISILGGVIDFLYYTIWANSKQYFSAEDTFKIGLLRSGIPVLAMNILSRIPVNLVDRFIVIFGGYFISRGISRLMRLKIPADLAPQHP